MISIKSFGFIFLGLAVLFLILAIAVPSGLFVNTDPFFCAEDDALRPGDQLVCDNNWEANYLAKRWTLEFSKEASKHVKVYKVDNFWPFIIHSNNYSYYRNYTAPIETATIKSKKYHVVPIPVPTYVYLHMNMNCSDNIDIYALTSREYEDAGGLKGKFDSSKVPDYKKGKQCVSPSLIDFVSGLRGYTSYLVFENRNDKDVTISFQNNLNVKVYNMSNYTQLNTKDENVMIFPTNNNDEAIILDYDYNGTEIIHARIYDMIYQWSAIVVTAVVFSLLTLLFVVFGLLFVIKNESFGVRSNYEKMDSEKQQSK